MGSTILVQISTVILLDIAESHDMNYTYKDPFWARGDLKFSQGILILVIGKMV